MIEPEEIIELIRNWFNNDYNMYIDHPTHTVNFLNKLSIPHSNILKFLQDLTDQGYFTCTNLNDKMQHFRFSLTEKGKIEFLNK